MGWIPRFGFPRRRRNTNLKEETGKSLNRYFPELIDPLRAQLPTRCVVDGELVIAKGGVLDFEALQLRSLIRLRLG